MRFIRKHLIEYQLVILVIYLVAMCFTSSMKIILPIYIVFSSLPFCSGVKKLERIPFIVFSISAVYVIFGLLFQDKTETLVSFLSKTYQFIIFMMVLSYMKRHEVEAYNNGKKLMWFALAVESILGAYLLTQSTLIGDNGLTRITAGRQPVGGNFAVVIVPILVYSYFRYNHMRGKLVAISLATGLWVFLSGTRGYMLLYFLSLFPMYIDYFFSMEKKHRYKTCLSILLAIGIVLFVVVNTNIWDTLSVMLRLESGTGIRGSENKIAIEFFNNTTIRYKVFGIGYGGRPADAPGYLSAVSNNVSGAWSYSNYADRIGVSFHNLYSNFVLLQGIIGILEVVIIFIWGLGKIKSIESETLNERRCIYLYWIGFFIMNCFRWSCDCGIAEMIVLALVIGMMNSKQNRETDFSSVIVTESENDKDED